MSDILAAPLMAVAAAAQYGREKTMAQSLIITEADCPDVKGVNSNLDSMGRGSADSIEGNTVVLTVKDMPTGDPHSIATMRDK